MNSLMNYGNGSDDEYDDSPEQRSTDSFGTSGRNYRRPPTGGGGMGGTNPQDDTNYDEVQMSLSEDSDAESKPPSKYSRDREERMGSPSRRESRDSAQRDRRDDRPGDRYGGRDRNEDRSRRDRDDERAKSREDDRARSRDDDRARSRDDDRARSRDDDRTRSRDDDRARSRDDDRARSRDIKDDKPKPRDDDRNRDRNRDRDDDKKDRRDDRRPRSRDKDRYSSRDDRYKQDRDRRRSRSPRDSRDRERRRSRSPRRSRSRSRDRINRGGFRRFDRGNNRMDKNVQRQGNNPGDTSQNEDGQNKDRFFMPGITGRFRDQIEKRKLLWQKKESDNNAPQQVAAVAAPVARAAPSVGQNPNAPRTTKVWESTTFAQDTDGKVASKFKRLMGIKTPTDGSVPGSEVMKKQDEMFSAMEQQYEVARTTTHTMRGVGLGFSSYNR